MAGPGNGGLTMPDGFSALVVIDSIGLARHLAVNDNGDIYVKLSYNDSMNRRGGTVALRDLDGDGRADSVIYFGDYTDSGQAAVGVNIHNGYLYTSTVSNIYRNKLKSGELVPTSETETILHDDRPNNIMNWHTTKPPAFDGNGNMYISLGAPTNGGQDVDKAGPAGIPNGVGLDPAPELKTSAGVWKFSEDKRNQSAVTDGHRVATGIRSVVGMSFSPLDKKLYAVVNGTDNFHTLFQNRFTSWQGSMLPAEMLIEVKEGDDYGWPYGYYDQMEKKYFLEPGYGGDGKKIGRAAKFSLPAVAFPGHWAPMDILFYQGNQFPDRYKQGAFVAFHGSTDRAPYPQAGYIVCFVPFVNGKFTGDYEVFADGFAGVDTIKNTSDALYRPMGLAEGPDGSLYVSESNIGRIWRVMYPGDKTKFSTSQLAGMEKLKTSRTYIKDPDPVRDNIHSSNVMKGGILFNTYCATCHQRDGNGDNNRYPPLAGSETVRGNKDSLINIILNGLRGQISVKGKTYNGIMPAHGSFLDDDAIASILSYIRRNKHFDNHASAIGPLEVSEMRGMKKTGTK